MKYNERKLKKELTREADSMLQAKKDRLTAFYQPTEQVQTRAPRVRRLVPAVVCALLLAVLFAALALQTDAPGAPSGESSVLELSETDCESSKTDESIETSEQSREESTPEQPIDALRYCEIVQTKVPDEIEMMNSSASVFSLFGSALQTKMRLYADDPSYRFHVVVYSADSTDGMAEEDDKLTARDQAALLQVSTEHWMRVEWMKDSDAYYCRLTAEELYALNSCSVICLYVGSGKAESSQTNETLQTVEYRLELYGDRLIGVFPEDEREEKL